VSSAGAAIAVPTTVVTSSGDRTGEVGGDGAVPGEHRWVVVFGEQGVDGHGDADLDRHRSGGDLSGETFDHGVCARLAQGALVSSGLEGASVAIQRDPGRDAPSAGRNPVNKAMVSGAGRTLTLRSVCTVRRRVGGRLASSR